MAIYRVAVNDGGKSLGTLDLRAMTTVLKAADEDLCDIKIESVVFGTVLAGKRSSASSDQHIMVVCGAYLCNRRERQATVSALAKATSAQLIAALYWRHRYSLAGLVRGPSPQSSRTIRERTLFLACDRLGICPYSMPWGSRRQCLPPTPRDFLQVGGSTEKSMPARCSNTSTIASCLRLNRLSEGREAQSWGIPRFEKWSRTAQSLLGDEVPRGRCWFE